MAALPAAVAWQIQDNVDFTVGRREIVTLIGPNGAGKSTLVKVVRSAARASRQRRILRPP